MMTPDILLVACLLDAAIGDPRWMPHPVRLMGRVISRAEAWVRPASRSRSFAWLAGLCLAIGLPATAYGLARAGIALAGDLHGTLGTIAEAWLAATTLAARDLSDHALAVERALGHSLEAARRQLSRIVGRDTESLSETEVVRGAVESVAESSCDGVIAPLFYLAVGGAPLALAYKAINTLDSVVGHRTLEHRDFGWASARLDDLMNFIPARLAAGLLIVGGAIQCRAVTRIPAAARILCRDGGKHPSPNSGRPEAAMAGVLQVRLGGITLYQGQAESRPYLGDPVRSLERDDIARSVRIMWTAYVLGLPPALGLVAL